MKITSLLDFNIDKREEYHNVYMMRDKYGKLYTDEQIITELMEAFDLSR